MARNVIWNRFNNWKNTRWGSFTWKNQLINQSINQSVTTESNRKANQSINRSIEIPNTRRTQKWRNSPLGEWCHSTQRFSLPPTFCSRTAINIRKMTDLWVKNNFSTYRRTEIDFRHEHVPSSPHWPRVCSGASPHQGRAILWRVHGWRETPCPAGDSGVFPPTPTGSGAARWTDWAGTLSCMSCRREILTHAHGTCSKGRLVNKWED